MAISGVELDPGSDFPGMHVGSYYNKLLKRCLLKSGSPAVVFLDEFKFPYTFRPDECYSICGPDLPWERVLEEVPLAFALATSTEEIRDRSIEHFETAGARGSARRILAYDCR